MRILSWSIVGVVVLTTSACSLGSSGSTSSSPVRTVVVTTTAAPPSSTAPAVGNAAATQSVTPSASATAVPSWNTVFERVSSGVVRIDESGCEDGGTGTGFLIAPSLVATVDHVVDGASDIRVTSPGLATSTSGTVIGVDKVHDLALIRTTAPIPGHVFTFSSQSPDIGKSMAAIGFPLGGSIQLTTGHVTGTHNHRTVGDDGVVEYTLSDVLLSDAALNPGNSGGPWLTHSGAVIALSESGPPYSSDGNSAQGNNGGVSAINAAVQFAAWRADPQEIPAGSCASTPTSEQGRLATLSAYFYDINKSDYGSAYAQLANATPNGLNTFISGVESSQDHDPAHPDDDAYPFVEDGAGTDATGPYVDVTFESHQDADRGPDGSGQTCTHWTLRYHFVVRNGLALIQDSVAQPGESKYRAC